MAKHFPKQLFVVRQDDGDDGHFYLTFDDEGDAIDAAGNGGEVALYKLDQLTQAEIVRALNPIWPRKK